MANNKQRIILIGPNWIGDLVMASAFIEALRQETQCHITLACRPPLQALAKRISAVDEVMPLPLPSGAFPLTSVWQFVRQLRALNFHRAIVLSPSAKYAILPWLAGIKQRQGLIHGRQIYRCLVRTAKGPKPDAYWQRLWQLLSTPASTRPQATLVADRVAGERLLANAGSAKTQRIGFCPGAEYGPAKRWPARHFAQLAQKLIAQGYQIVLLGSPKEQDSAREVQAACANACVDLTGKTNLAEVVDVMACLSAVICNDSGLMHVAAAVQIPVVAIYGSSSYHYTPPLSNLAQTVSLDLDCSPCFKRACPLGHTRCLTELSAEKIYQTLLLITQEEEHHAALTLTD